MRLSLVNSVLSTLAVRALALPTAHVDHVIHEKRDNIQRKWIQGNALEWDHILPARIGLKQNNLDLGAQYLHEVSDPRSPRYGKHYTSDEVAELFAPSATTVDTVLSWLADAGIHESRVSQSANRAWLQFDASVEEMEQLLQTKYHFYEHVDGGRKHIGCEDYQVPVTVSQHIDYVTPGVKLLATRGMGEIKKRSLSTSATSRQPIRKPMPADVLAKLKQNPAATDTCGTAITPACIKAMYNITAGTLKSSKNTLGIFEFGDIYAQGDLDSFYQTYASNIPKGTKPKSAFVDGATAPTTQDNAGGESDLDFEIAYPIIYPQGTTLYQTDAAQWDFTNRPGIFNTWLDAIDGSYCTYASNGETGDDAKIDPVYTGTTHMCGKYTPTNVISLSYGLVEADFPTYYQVRQCNEFMKLGLQGVTIVFASGDAGVSDRNGNCLGPNQTIFSPDYPDCPYVTMVGATTLPAGSSAGDPETAVTSFSSGGGFSNIYGQPSYQQSAINSYFANSNPPYAYYSSLNGSLGANGGIYNRIGRGFPDVSACGDNAALVVNGYDIQEGGTSMSAPLVASIFTRINEERIAAGKGPIGFANPTLYANPQMFHDITVGDQSQGGCGTNGFSAVPGWDPVTGLGTPKYDQWLEVFLALP